MIAASVLIGVIFGGVWGNLFTSRLKPYTKSPLQSASCRPSAWILASTSIIRYLLLAALLVVLVVKYNLLLAWWVAGFLPSFWLMLVKSGASHSVEAREKV